MWLPGLVFLGLCVWLIRKVVRAARTEGDLESDRLQGALAQELQAAKARAAGKAPLAAVPAADTNARGAPSAAAPGEERLAPDLAAVDPAHLELIRALVAEREQQVRARQVGPTDVPVRVELLWARSNATHAVWCERRHAATLAARAMTRDVICVAQIEKGKVVERWSFG